MKTLPRCRSGILGSLPLVVLSGAVLVQAADYSKEPFVVQDFVTRVGFTANGERDWRQTMSVRLQSEAAVRQYGVLGMSYNAQNEQVEFEYVRVHKPDGSVVETPVASAMDAATPVAMSAPTYSDLRQKQIPVKSLGVGDVLEYSLHSRQTKPDVPGQFWYTAFFPDNNVVLHETLEIRVPKDKYVQVASPKLKNETREDGGQRVYTWTYTQLEPSKPVDPKKRLAEPADPPKAQITTFHNWEEVGQWWRQLAAPAMQTTPQIEAKARELTSGLVTNEEKARAIYEYVATHFRYISISFGQGRYQPHSAQEVLANQYGDCKDKHTLLAAILKAAGIEAWPGLIGAGIKFDPALPSPAQFNHVITVLPESGKYIWLDSTSEVAPFGMLVQKIRDEQALVIPGHDKPVLMKTPADPPFVSHLRVNVKAALTAEGTLTARFDYDMFGDESLVVRTVLHQLAPAQWQTFAQGMSYGMSYAGDVSGVNVEHLEDSEKPLKFSYDYKRKNYSDWSEHRITPPVPPISFGPGPDAEQPKEAFWTGAPGEADYTASVELPKGFSVELPRDASVTSAFADYSSHYEVKDGVLAAERKLTIKKSKASPGEWSEYQTFIKAITDDQRHYVVLNESGNPVTATAGDDNPEARALVQKAMAALRSRDRAGAWQYLDQAERINPKQPGLWSTRGLFESAVANQQPALADFRKELELHPNDVRAAQVLFSYLALTRHWDEAVDLARVTAQKHPENQAIVASAARLLLQRKHYPEVPVLLEKPLTIAPGDPVLRSLRAEALLRTGKIEDRNAAIAEAQKLRDSNAEPLVRNDLAYALADTGTAIGLAEELASSAVKRTEEDAGRPSLAHFDEADLRRVLALGSQWDTLGWVYFKQCASDSRSDQHSVLEKAEKYVNAAWQIMQRADLAEHLGEIYAKEGRREPAIRMWRFALALNPDQQDAKDHLHAVGVSEQLPATMRIPTPVEQLAKLRTTGIPSLPKQTANAEFLILAASGAASVAQFVSGSDSLKSAGPAVQSAYKFPFPDDGPEKIIRRGILSCSMYTSPSCQFTLIPAENTHK